MRHVSTNNFIFFSCMSDFQNKKNYTNQTFFGKSCAELENNADSGGNCNKHDRVAFEEFFNGNQT